MPAPANWKTPQRNVKEKSELAKGVSRTGDTRWIAASDDILSNKYASGRLVIKEFVQTDSVPELFERRPRGGTGDCHRRSWSTRSVPRMKQDRFGKELRCALKPGLFVLACLHAYIAVHS